MHIRFLVLISSVALSANTSVATAQSAKEAKPYKVIVVGEKATLRAGNKTLAPLGLGEILTISKQKDGWLFSPIRLGWVKADHTLPLDKAIGIFSRKLREKPTAEFYHHRGLAYQARNEHKEAINDFTAALKLAPGYTSIYNNRGKSWHAIGSANNAIADFSKAIKLDVNTTQAYNNRGLVRFSQGKLKEAIADFDKALKLRPTYAEAYNNRGNALRRQGKLGAAFADYNRAIKWNPRFAPAFANRGSVYKQRRDYAKAVADYGASLRLNNYIITTHNDLAWLLATCPDKKYRNGKQAVEHARYACEQTRFRDWNMLETLAAAYAEKGEFDQAVTWAKEARRRAPKQQQAKLKKLAERFADRKPLRVK